MDLLNFDDLRSFCSSMLTAYAAELAMMVVLCASFTAGWIVGKIVARNQICKD